MRRLLLAGLGCHFLGIWEATDVLLKLTWMPHTVVHEANALYMSTGQKYNPIGPV